jgi:SnoaL-like domain
MEPQMSMDPIESIKQLKARYFRTMDTKDWAGLRRVISDDIVVDTTASGGAVTTGADDFIETLQQTLAGAVTVHHGHTPEIRLTSETTATGIWALQDTIIWPDGSRLLGFGHYHESYELLEDEWRIKELTLTRLHMEISDPPTERA